MFDGMEWAPERTHPIGLLLIVGGCLAGIPITAWLAYHAWRVLLIYPGY